MAANVADILFIGACIVGVLSILGLIPGVPKPAAYTMIGLGGLALLDQMLMLALSKGDSLGLSYIFLRAAISANPQNYITEN